MIIKDQFARAAVVVKSDTADIVKPYGGAKKEGAILRVNDITGGDVIKVQTFGGDIITYKGVVVGEWLPVHVVKVFDTDTTVTEVVAHW